MHSLKQHSDEGESEDAIVPRSISGRSIKCLAVGGILAFLAVAVGAGTWLSSGVSTPPSGGDVGKRLLKLYYPHVSPGGDVGTRTMELYFLRHGHGEHETPPLGFATPDAQLDEQGHTQTKAWSAESAKQLKAVLGGDAQLDLVLFSPLRRTVQSGLNAIANYNTSKTTLWATRFACEKGWSMECNNPSEATGGALKAVVTAEFGKPEGYIADLYAEAEALRNCVKAGRAAEQEARVNGLTGQAAKKPRHDLENEVAAGLIKLLEALAKNQTYGFKKVLIASHHNSIAEVFSQVSMAITPQPHLAEILHATLEVEVGQPAKAKWTFRGRTRAAVPDFTLVEKVLDKPRAYSWQQ